jgi:Ca-activated chloride channel family protein
MLRGTTLLGKARVAFILLALVPGLGIAKAQLPSAPSAVQQEKQKPQAPPPAPAPAQPSAPPASAPASTGSESVLPTTSGSEPDESVATFRAHVDEVSMVFTVTDKRGRFIKDLAKDDFTILDDNKPPQAVVSFRGETDLPLRLGLLIDASNSVRDRFRFEQEAAVQFLNQNIRYGYDQAFVVGFDTTYEVTQDFTDDTEKLTNGVRTLRPGGGTSLYDAFYFACRDKLLKESQNGRRARRAIILLSDGDDNQSHVSREEAIDMALRAEVIVYAISTNLSGQKGKGDKVLERMAEATGGRVFFPFQIEDVTDFFTEIEAELRSQYALAYKPSDFRRDGHYRKVSIIAQNKKDLRVRARPGYYAPQD